MRADLVLLLLLLIAPLPWLDQPVHYDEANFLVLAEGAARDPWRPHAVRINWQGTEQPAFEVLSNPPGIAWWQAPMRGQPIPLRRAWMLPWWWLAAWGAWRLADRIAGSPSAALPLLAAPVALLSSAALLPDGPLYALVLAGSAGLLDSIAGGRRLWPWALVLGCASLFRYSALPLPLVWIAWALSTDRRDQVPGLLAGFVPAGLLALHDLHAYGEIHLLAMGRFQSVSNSLPDLHHKAAAALAMLGGAVALPTALPGRGAGGPMIAGALIGAGLGAAWGWQGALFAAAGGAALGSAGGAGRERLRLGLWAGGGFLSLMALRFTAARYWLPFAPAVLMGLHRQGSPAQHRIAALLSASLGLALLADQHRAATAHRDLAEVAVRIGEQAEIAAAGSPGWFAGHWGFQWYMEQAGWRAVEAGAAVPAGRLLATVREAWPQPVEGRCAPFLRREIRPEAAGLRGYAPDQGANLHANWVMGEPDPVRTVLPWAWSGEAYEGLVICRGE